MSNADYLQARRLLKSMARFQGESLREKEAIRKARLLSKKLDRKESSKPSSRNTEMEVHAID